jgi:hypothetical protein
MVSQAQQMSGGALKIKSGVYVDIEEFLEDKYPDLFDVVTSLRYPIQVRNAGVTFLVPSKGFIKDLVDLRNGEKAVLSKYKEEVDFLVKEGNNPNPAQMGVTLAKAFLRSLILTWYYPTAESFSAEQRVIINKGYRLYKLESVSKDKVKLEIGELTKEPSFELYKERAGDDKSQVAVWHLSGTPKINTPKHTAKEIAGGLKAYNHCLTGQQVALHIYNKIREYKKAKIDIEIVYLVTLLEYIESKDKTLYEQLGCVISPDALVSLLLILKPGNQCMLIPEEMVRDWFRTTYFNIRPNAAATYKQICETMRNLPHVLELTFNSLKEQRTATVENMIRMGSNLNECDICDEYERVCHSWYPIYKGRHIEKINDDVFRAVYQENNCDWEMIIPRLKNSDHRIKYHFLNPDFECFGSDREKGLNEFIKSPYFLYCIGCANDCHKYSLTIREPKFDINVERLEHLLKLVKETKA